MPAGALAELLQATAALGPTASSDRDSGVGCSSGLRGNFANKHGSGESFRNLFLPSVSIAIGEVRSCTRE